MIKLAERQAQLHDAEELAIIEYSARKSDSNCDLAGVTLPLLAERWRQHIRSNIANAKGGDIATVIASVENHDVGVASVSLPVVASRRCALWAIYVRSGYQRQGIGTYLLSTLAHRLEAYAISELYIEKCEHESGLQFCRKHRAELMAGLLCWSDLKPIREHHKTARGTTVSP